MLWWVLISLVFIVSSVWGTSRLVSFLAYSNPIDADVLIVEGWLAPSYLKAAVEEFRGRGYSHLFVVGECEPSEQKANGTCDTERSATILRQLGVEPSKITVVSVRPNGFHRTWSYATALRVYLKDKGFQAKTANILSLWVHARKSLVVFQKALGPDIKVGVISAKHDRFSLERWWLSARGVYAVIKNGVAYLDAVLFTGWGCDGTSGNRS